MNDQSYVSIFVKDIRVQVRVGLLEEEKRAPQFLDVSVELFVDLAYLELAKNGQILDYALFYDFVMAWGKRDHTLLLEPLVQELADYAFTFDTVQAVRASVAKPDIFDQAGQAGVEVFLRRDDMN